MDVAQPVESTLHVGLDRQGQLVLDLMFLAPHVVVGPVGSAARDEWLPAPVQDGRKLRVQLKSALNLINADTMTESDPYVVFHMVRSRARRADYCSDSLVSQPLFCRTLSRLCCVLSFLGRVSVDTQTRAPLFLSRCESIEIPR